MGDIATSELTRLDPSGHAHGKPTEGLECLCTMEDITQDDSK